MNIATKIRLKFRRKWNYLFNNVRGIVGLNEQLFQQARGARILVYHGICQTDHTRFNSIFLRRKTFEEHLKFYRKYFQVISLNDFYNQKFSKDRFNICITFDDGFANNCKYVLPLMNRYQVPVTFFITAVREAGYDILWNDFLCLAQKYGPSKVEFLNDRFYKNKYRQYVSAKSKTTLKDLLREEGFDRKAELIKFFEPFVSAKNKIRQEDYWLQMTPPEIKMLSTSPLATIGCHGYYHNDLSRISSHAAREEIVRAKLYLENIIEKNIEAIAFPYGAYSRDVITAAKLAGFKQLLAADFIFSDDYSDPVMRERFTVNPYISVNNQMIAIITGKYEH